ncbi:MAG: hypothetical protein F6K14_16195 [Symploca sp. SIO2C1]|nr:hypothetical protein [Symploca sp. SIO2C1]
MIATALGHETQHARTFLSNYQLALAEDKPVKFQRRGLMLTPQGGIEMVMTGKR